MSDAFWSGLWAGVFELLAIGLVAGWVNVIYQRIRSRQALRSDLIDEIDQFSTSLYKPRKIYQHLLSLSADQRANREAELLRCLEELTSAAGRFRAIQVKLIPLFGFDVEMLAHYLAVWRAIREVRKRMERSESLFATHESSDSSDALYRLLDQFRYRAQVTPSVRHKPSLLSPPPALSGQIEERSSELYQQYISPPNAS